MKQSEVEIHKRRTFAIISHPDAGKTTLTESFLLLGGAIQVAGAVRAKRNQHQTRSDWLEIEKERGISVATSVLTFDYRDHRFNLLDTPGHADFSEDTYRTLSAVDSAIMVLDAAKGIEERTYKLFEICRMRNIPIVTYINKVDREMLEPLALLSEIEQKLALDVVPRTWPIGRGDLFCGIYSLDSNAFEFHKDRPDERSPVYEQDFEDLALVKEAYLPFSKKSFQEGSQTPVYFGSAIKKIGLEALLNCLIDYAPYPTVYSTKERTVYAVEEKMTGFVFKVQANMDKHHRDRVAFLKVCSGNITKGMKAYLVRTGKQISLTAPQFFFAQERTGLEKAYAGDIVGIVNHGTLKIGDTLTEGESLHFHGLPRFSPELFRRVKISDALKATKLKEALHQLSDEGVLHVFEPEDGSPLIVGVIGTLQLDVLKVRLDIEYNLSINYEMTSITVSRWISYTEKEAFETFRRKHRTSIAKDLEGTYVFLTSSLYTLRNESERHPKLQFLDVKV